jgi:hypothetical protein
MALDELLEVRSSSAPLTISATSNYTERCKGHILSMRRTVILAFVAQAIIDYLLFHFG